MWVDNMLAPAGRHRPYQPLPRLRVQNRSPGSNHGKSRCHGRGNGKRQRAQRTDPSVGIADIGASRLLSEESMGHTDALHHLNQGPQLYRVPCAFVIPQDSLEGLQMTPVLDQGYKICALLGEDLTVLSVTNSDSKNDRCLQGQENLSDSSIKTLPSAEKCHS